MTKRHTLMQPTAAVLFAAVLALSWTANANADILLKWSDSSIVGNSTLAGYVGDVQLQSYSQNASRVTVQAPTICGQVTLLKNLDPSSVGFLNKVFTGATTSLTVPVTINFVEVSSLSPTNYYSVQLYGVVVTGITRNSPVGDTGLPTETVTLQATKYRYNDLTVGAPTSFGWDWATNSAF
jgi:type VI protein secretion system component Hcp